LASFDALENSPVQNENAVNFFGISSDANAFDLRGSSLFKPSVQVSFETAVGLSGLCEAALTVFVAQHSIEFPTLSVESVLVRNGGCVRRILLAIKFMVYAQDCSNKKNSLERLSWTLGEFLVGTMQVVITACTLESTCEEIVLS
jgi:hypothetical protein